MTQVKTGSSVLKAFAYGTGATTKDAGKVLTADRYNYIQIGTTPFTVQVRETYAYAGVGGAVSSRATQVYVNGGAQEAFTQGWTWNDLGDATTLTYPRCTHAACNGGALSSRSVSFGYTNGFLTSVPSYATSIAYHPNGMVKNVIHANGVTWNQAADPYGMARPASYSTTGATSNNWTSGTYGYDGAGNVTAIGGSTFTYDAVSRLTASSVKIGVVAGTGTTATQAVTYDTFGNITAMTTSGAGSLNLGTSATTNRMTYATYDTMGSMTSWNGNIYEYDAFGMAWRVTASSIQYEHIYTADDERIWTFQSGAPSRWTVRDLDGKVLREFKNNAGTWSVERDYVHRDGTLLAAVTGTGAVEHFHPDHLGTPRLITTTGAAYQSYHVYHPYGTEATTFNQDTERMKFTGHERDLGNTSSTADDLDYMHARFYNMQIGRMLSFDRVGGNKRNPQSLNRFSYSLNNPLKFVDPDGNRPTSQQGQNTFQRAVDEVSLFFQAILRSLMGEDEKNPQDSAQNPDPIDPELAEAGIDSSMFPENQAQLYKDSFVEANATVGATLVVAGATIAEQVAINRILGIIQPSGRYIGSAGSSSRIRMLSGGGAEAEKFYLRLARGGKAIEAPRYAGKMVEVARGVRVGYRPSSVSGPPTVDLFIGDAYVKFKFI